MASAESEPITGVWGQSPQWGQGVRGLKHSAVGPPKRWAKICHFSLVFLKLSSNPKIMIEMDRTCELLALESFSDYCK